MRNNLSKFPVLLILFDRTEFLDELFLSLSAYEPKRLYVSIDGPRDSNFDVDEKNLNDVKKLIEDKITWECETFTNYSNKNHGPGKGPRKSIDWFFENEEAGIILEDDCIPCDSFFEYCSHLLDEYKNEKSVFLISGDNGGPLLEQSEFDCSYDFVSLPLIWGWATWQDRWEQYTLETEVWKDSFSSNKKYLKNYGHPEQLIVNNLFKNFSKIKNKNYKYWDFQLFSTVLTKDKMCIIPKYNLISNKGFGQNSTNNLIENYRSNYPTTEMKEIKIASSISLNKKLNNKLLLKVHTNFYDKKYLKENKVSKYFYFYYSIIKNFYNKILSYLIWKIKGWF
tara:strand:- start:15232 stop:16245 length:1014 start_codon:yes stop_codon:yes gene_type:complete